MKLEELSTQSCRLGNGLRAVIVPMPETHRVVVDLALRAGPAYESKRENGICHFLEHMLYRGTPSAPSAHAQADAFETLGGTLVATTYVDHGTMAIGIPPESLHGVLPLFAEVYAEPVFDGIEIEKGIVREEMLESLDDDGNLVDADELARAVCFPDHALGYPIVGNLKRLTRVDEAALRRAHDRLYVGENAVVVVAGKVEPDRALRELERHFSGVPRGAPLDAPGLDVQPERGLRSVHDVSSQTELRIVFRAPPELDPLEPATELLLRIIDDGMSTRLYHRICDERGLCYDVSAGYEAYVAGGIFDFAAEVAHERAPLVFDEIIGLVRELRDEGPTDLELDKAKTRLSWNFDAMLDDPAEMATFMATGLLSGVAPSLAERRARLLAVRLSDVRRAAETIFSSQTPSVLAVGGIKKRERNLLERSLREFG